MIGNLGGGVFKYSPRTLLGVSREELNCIHRREIHLLPHEQYQAKWYRKPTKLSQEQACSTCL